MIFDDDIGCKVQLNTDLTYYHNSLVVGVEGITTGRRGPWSRNHVRFVTVKFPEIELDIVWKNLNKVDPPDVLP